MKQFWITVTSDTHIVIGAYLHKVNDEYVFTGSYSKHNKYNATNEKRYMVTLDEYFEEYPNV